MKKTVSVEVTSKTTRKVELDFPIYRTFDHGDESMWTHHYQLDANGREVCITQKRGTTTEGWEIEIDDRSGLEYESGFLLGTGSYFSESQEDFEIARAACMKFIAEA